MTLRAPAAVRIASLRGVATVQDGGRPGRMHEGVPPGGALVPELLARANRAVGNDDGAAAIELFGGATLVADADAVVGTSDGATARLAVGDAFDVAPHAYARVTYIAIAGGIDVPEVLGGRGTLLVAKIGGLEGRPLKRGDRLSARLVDAVPAPRALAPFVDLDASIELVAGPDTERFASSALATLVSSEYRIATTGDRVGIRLDGPALPRSEGDSDGGGSGPMVKGAIEVPASGGPIVLGPDHPTTGGYPVIAVVARRSFGNFAARKPGAVVRFTLMRTFRA